MKFKGYTDTSDWRPETLIWMLRHGNWYCGATWRQWRLGFDYTWYDGPLFQVRVGPFWVTLH